MRSAEQAESRAEKNLAGNMCLLETLSFAERCDWLSNCETFQHFNAWDYSGGALHGYLAMKLVRLYMQQEEITFLLQ